MDATELWEGETEKGLGIIDYRCLSSSWGFACMSGKDGKERGVVGEKGVR